MKTKNRMLLIPTMVMMVTLLGNVFQSCKEESKPFLPPVEAEFVEKWSPGHNAFVWVDAMANVFQSPGRFRNKNDIKLILDSLKYVGINGLVIDVKHNTGFTLYESNYTQKLSSYNGLTMLSDYVEFMFNEARSRQMKVYLAMNTFVYGNTTAGVGYVYNNPGFKQYESIVMNASGNRVPISQTGGNVFLNPAAPEVQELTVNIVKEMATKFSPDGIVLDYCRYRGIDADFSDLSKELFIQFLEEKYNDNQAKYMDFPKDIVSSWKVVEGNVEPNATGKNYKKWLHFRAMVLKDFFARTKQELKSVAPHVELGAYSGAWYNTYYKQGNNFASETYDPFNDEELTFSAFATPGYKETGYAEQLDLFFSGNYFKQLYLKDNPATAHLKYHWWSIEGSMNGIEYITRNKMKVYSGIDVGNVTYDSEEDISKAINYMYNRSNGGVLVFDVCHITVPRYNPLKKGLWDAVKNGLIKN
ncbi:MAG: family 10 glycosylhydrolase [Sphingobacterium sp.]|jgi:uncharacterized lipoprotein YddW (UPF0748 family)|nr:family 10 glycosylhydrolase [Sphingobacterium sp.]